MQAGGERACVCVHALPRQAARAELHGGPARAPRRAACSARGGRGEQGLHACSHGRAGQCMPAHSDQRSMAARPRPSPCACGGACARTMRYAEALSAGFVSAANAAFIASGACASCCAACCFLASSAAHHRMRRGAEGGHKPAVSKGRMSVRMCGQTQLLMNRDCAQTPHPVPPSALYSLSSCTQTRMHTDCFTAMTTQPCCNVARAPPPGRFGQRPPMPRRAC